MINLLVVAQVRCARIILSHFDHPTLDSPIQPMQDSAPQGGWGMFDQVVSLGAWCQTAEQIRRLGLPTAPSPFDWVGATLNSTANMIDDGCEHIAKRCTIALDGVTPACSHYGALLTHEFPNGVTEERAAEVRSKMLHKMKRFDDACRSGARTLFVRMGGHADPSQPWPYMFDHKPLRGSDIERLIRVIEKRYPTLDFHITFALVDRTVGVVPGQFPERASRAWFRWPSNSIGWDGNDDEWRRVLGGVSAHHSLAA